MNSFTWLKQIGDSARSTTALLEACDWDEEECKALLERLSEFLPDFVEAHPNVNEDSSPEQQRQFYNNLRVGLQTIAESHQIDTIVEYLSMILGIESGDTFDD